MIEMERIRNACRELYAMFKADEQKYAHTKKSLTPEAKEKAINRLWNFENQLRTIEMAINDMAPIEIAADQHARAFKHGGNKTTFYRQIFDREGLREESKKKANEDVS